MINHSRSQLDYALLAVACALVLVWGLTQYTRAENLESRTVMILDGQNVEVWREGKLLREYTARHGEVYNELRDAITHED